MAALFGATHLLCCPPARADGTRDAEEEDPIAKALDADGTALLSQRRVAEACPKLAESFRRRPGTGVLLRLALCQELLGKRGAAWTYYMDAAERARAADDQRLIALAERRAAALEPLLSRLTIHLDATAQEAPSVEVLRNGSPLELTSLGQALPVDPGPQVIEAMAPGRRPFQGTVVVSEAPSSYSITITLPIDRAEPLLARDRGPTDSVESSSWSTQQWLAVGAGGVGLVGLTIGTVLGIDVSSKMSRARDGCTTRTGGCSDEALALQEDARSSARVSTIAFGAGLAGIAGGVALWLTAPEDEKRPLEASVRAAPLIDRGTAGLQAVGTW